MGKEQEAGSATASGGARIVVVGGGVAGLEIATALGKGRTEAIGSVTLVDSDSAHVWKPMLHTIAAGTRDLAQQQTTYLAQASDASFAYQPGEMCGLDMGKLRAAVDESCKHLFSAAGYTPDVFSTSFPVLAKH